MTLNTLSLNTDAHVHSTEPQVARPSRKSAYPSERPQCAAAAEQLNPTGLETGEARNEPNPTRAGGLSGRAREAAERAEDGRRRGRSSPHHLLTAATASATLEFFPPTHRWPLYTKNLREFALNKSLLLFLQYAATSCKHDQNGNL